MGAVLRAGAIRPGTRVAVFGLGAVGLAAVMAARVGGATEILAVDPVAAKHDIARRAGATDALSPADFAALPSDGAVDLAIEASGAVPAMQSAFAALARGGRLVAVGLPDPARTVDLPALDFAGQGKSIIGSYMGDAVPSEDVPTYLRWWAEGRLPLELLHTDTRPLSEINEGLDDLLAGRVVRRLFVPGEGRPVSPARRA
jgi:Zn-dependent alcohol dehydrogenase